MRLSTKYSSQLVLCCLITLFLRPVFGFSGEVYLDKTFGYQGQVSGSDFSLQGRGYGVTVQSDGKILIAGSESTNNQRDFSLLRLNSDGSPDQYFGTNGQVVTPVSPYDDEAIAVVILDDDRIVVGGYSENDQDRDFAMVCYFPDGTLDQGFGSDGIVITQVGNKHDEITALYIGQDGSIFVSGVAEGTNGRIIVAAKYTPNGFPDYTFGEDGLSLVGVGEDVVAQGITEIGNGEIIISGSYSESEFTSCVLVRFTADGVLDSSFGQDGIAGVLTDQHSEGYGVSADYDGLIYVAGSIKQGEYSDATLFRFTENGSPDFEFGDNGYTILFAGPEDDVFYDVKIMTDGRIVASGFTTEDGTRQFLLGSYVTSEQESSSDPVVLSSPVNISTLKVIESSSEEASFSEDINDEIEVKELKVIDSFEEYLQTSTFYKQLYEEQPEVSPSSFFSNVLESVVGFFVGEAHAEEFPHSEEQHFLTSVIKFAVGDTAGYALAVTDDGEVVVVGTSTDDEGQEQIAVAKFLSTGTETSASEELEDSQASKFITTTLATDINRTGGITGGEIIAGLGSISARGVVFSIAPYPVYQGDEGSNVDDFTVTITSPTSASTVTESTVSLTVSTSSDSTCGYNEGTDIGFDSMTKFPGSLDTSHTVVLTGLVDGDFEYFVRCQSSEDDEDASSVEFTVEISTVAVAQDLLRQVVNFAVSNAIAADEESSSAQGFFGGETSEDFLEEGQTEDGSGIGRYSSLLKNLKPGTVFYVRAYAISGGNVFYGNRIKFKTADSCFIATASFGTLFHPYVKVLRDFRDEFLVTNTYGNLMVELYYNVSPPIADFIAEHASLKLLVRSLLLPVIGFAWFSLHFGMLGAIVFSASLLLATVFLLKKIVQWNQFDKGAV